jgi:ABC-2 type transport system ATP-binding protein
VARTTGVDPSRPYPARKPVPGKPTKVQFAEAVLHLPALLVLDEPFANLDPENQELFVALIRELQAQGTTVLLSDHQLSLVERLANRICILSKGEVIAQGTLAQLRSQLPEGKRLRLCFADLTPAANLEFLHSHPAIGRVERLAGAEVRLVITNAVRAIEILNFVETRLRVSEIVTEPASLHDIYVRSVTTDNGRIREESIAVASG